MMPARPDIARSRPSGGSTRWPTARIAALLKVTGRSPEILDPPAPPAIEFESARAPGDTWALTELWQSLGFGELRRVFRKTRHASDVDALIRVMVLNRLCNPDSKLGVLRWLETVAIPGVKTSAITHRQLLRSMDALMDHQTDVDAVIAGLLRPLIEQDLSMVFCDLTTIRAAGQSEEDKDVRQFDMAKEGLIARQFMLGVVQTSDGLPIHQRSLTATRLNRPRCCRSCNRCWSVSRASGA